MVKLLQIWTCASGHGKLKAGQPDDTGTRSIVEVDRALRARLLRASRADRIVYDDALAGDEIRLDGLAWEWRPEVAIHLALQACA
jgi:hypothetical protein